MEEEKTETTETNSAPARKLPQAVDTWLETSFPASPTLSLCADLLKHYEKWWWQPHVDDGFYHRTKISTAAKMYTADLNQWQKFRVDLKDKMLRGGLPPVFEHNTDGKPRLKEPVRCDSKAHVGDRMTMAYGQQQVMTYLEGPGLIDKCDVCLSQPVSAGV